MSKKNISSIELEKKEVLENIAKAKEKEILIKTFAESINTITIKYMTSVNKYIKEGRDIFSEGFLDLLERIKTTREIGALYQDKVKVMGLEESVEELKRDIKLLKIKIKESGI